MRGVKDFTTHDESPAGNSCAISATKVTGPEPPSGSFPRKGNLPGLMPTLSRAPQNPRWDGRSAQPLEGPCRHTLVTWSFPMRRGNPLRYLLFRQRETVPVKRPRIMAAHFAKVLAPRYEQVLAAHATRAPKLARVPWDLLKSAQAGNRGPATAKASPLQ